MSRVQCFAHHQEAQLARRDGRLLDARTALRLCSRSACPGAIRADCVDWLDQVDHSVPSVVVTARARGSDQAKVRVQIDGKVVAERLTGAAIELDPGEHRFRFESAPWPAVERTVLISAGVKDRAIDVQFAAAPPFNEDTSRTADDLGRSPASVAAPAPAQGVATPSAGRRPGRAADYLLAAGAASGLGTFAYFAGTALRDRQRLEDRCAPFCSSADVADVRTKLIVADVALGVTAACLAAVLYRYIVRPDAGGAGGAAAVSRASASAGGSWIDGVSLSADPTSLGTRLTIRGAF